MRKYSLVAGVLALSVLASPAAAHHKPGHDGGPPHSSGAKKEDKGHGHGLRLGQVARGGLDDAQVDALADELRACLDDGDDLRELRRGQVKHLARIAGLSKHDLQQHRGDDLDALADRLRGRLADEDLLEDLSLGKVVQVAHSCGITTRELADLLDD